MPMEIGEPCVPIRCLKSFTEGGYAFQQNATYYLTKKSGNIVVLEDNASKKIEISWSVFSELCLNGFIINSL